MRVSCGHHSTRAAGLEGLVRASVGYALANWQGACVALCFGCFQNSAWFVNRGVSATYIAAGLTLQTPSAGFSGSSMYHLHSEQLAGLGFGIVSPGCLAFIR